MNDKIHLLCRHFSCLLQTDVGYLDISVGLSAPD